MAYTIELTATRVLTDPKTGIATSQTKTTTRVLRQVGNATLLRQEYVDYGRVVPPSASVVIVPAATTIPYFTPDNFAQKSSYTPLVVEGGMVNLAKLIRQEYGQLVLIGSAYRNPQWNKAVGGVDNSVHMSGGALDIQPTNQDSSTLMRALYLAAQNVPSVDRVILEQDAIRLLPINHTIIPSGHVFDVGGGVQITVTDQNNSDDLPDAVSAIVGATAGEPLSTTHLVYDNKTYSVTDTNGNGHIDVGEPLVTSTPIGTMTLDKIFLAATHVHADNNEHVGVAGSPLSIAASVRSLSATESSYADINSAAVATSPISADQKIYYRYTTVRPDGSTSLDVFGQTLPFSDF